MKHVIDTRCDYVILPCAKFFTMYSRVAVHV